MTPPWHWPRLLNLDELKCVGSFPDDQFVGARNAVDDVVHTWAGLKNSVPPLMPCAVGLHVRCNTRCAEPRPVVLKNLAQVTEARAQRQDARHLDGEQRRVMDGAQHQFEVTQQRIAFTEHRSRFNEQPIEGTPLSGGGMSRTAQLPPEHTGVFPL